MNSSRRSFRLACVLLLSAAAFISSARSQAIPRTVTVSGSGSVSAEPDTATINTGVQTNALTAQQALTANTQQFKNVLAVLTEQGIDNADIQTSFFNVNPQFDFNNQGVNQGITGYEVTNQVRVIVRDIDNLGVILDAVVTAGSNSVSGVTFSVEDDKELRNQARSLAVADATSRAAVFADAAGVAVGNIIAISEQTIRPPQLALAARSFSADAVPVSSGELDISASVFLQFEIIDAA